MSVLTTPRSRRDRRFRPGRGSIAVLGSLSLVAATLLAAPGARPRLVFAQLAPARIGVFVSEASGEQERALLSGDGRDYNPTWSADGRWIVFTSERHESADLYRIHPDGSGLERLTDDPAFDDQGVLSPDGTRLAFVSTRAGGRANIWVLDLRSRRVHNLTRNDRGNFRPAWSPDGAWVAFSSDRDQRQQRMAMDGCCGWELMQFTSVFVVRADGTQLRRVTPDGVAAGSPQWSADGRRLVYYESRGGVTPAQIVTHDLTNGERHAQTPPAAPAGVSPHFVGDATIAYLEVERPGNAHIVTTAGDRWARGAISNPSWSPDARTVVYQKVIAQADRDPLRLQSVRGIDRRFDLITAADPFSVRFSQDGSARVYAKNAGSEHTIELLSGEDGSSRTVFRGTQPDGLLGSIAWSPDRALIAFTIGRLASRNPVVPVQLGLIRADGSVLRTLVAADTNYGYPSFSPDGSQVVFRVFGREQGLRLLSIASGAITTVTTGWDNFPAWSPRGDRIAFTRARDGNFEIYTITPDGRGLRQLTHDGGNVGHPIWSPDGQHLVFTSSVRGWKDEVLLAAQGAQTYGDLFTMRVDGTDRRQVTDNQWEEAPSAWLPPSSLR